MSHDAYVEQYVLSGVKMKEAIGEKMPAGCVRRLCKLMLTLK